MIKQNDNMPKVSVIIPVYGVEKYIERCARSLFEQTLMILNTCLLMIVHQTRVLIFLNMCWRNIHNARVKL